MNGSANRILKTQEDVPGGFSQVATGGSRLGRPAVLAAAACALIALIGASGAQAETTLCEATESTCSGANTYREGTELHAVLESGTEATLTAAGGLVEIKCKESTVAGKTETTETPEGKLSSLTFGSCNNKVNVKKPGSLQIHWDAEHNGTLTASGFEVEVEASGLTCIYGGSVTSGLTLKGGNPATVEATATIPKSSGGFLCPGSSVWHAKYEVTSPKPLYVAKEGP